MLHSFKTIGKKWVSFLFLLTLNISLINAQDYYPYVIGYTAGQSVKHQTSADTFNVSFHGGSVVATQYKNIDIGKALAGMRYDLVLASNAFDKELFVSKGYFPDYIQLRWEINRYQSSLTGYRVMRKKLGAVDPFVQVAFLSKDASDWKDEFTEPGVLYEYNLLAEGLFPKQQKLLNFLEGVGFRLPSATISGRVTYKGGAAVEDVSLIAETSDKFSGTSLNLNGTDAYLAISPPSNHPHFKFDTAFTYQAWVKPTSTSSSVLFEKGSQYKITHSKGKINFRAGAQTLTLNFVQKSDTFFHVSAVRERDSLKVFVIYDEDTYYTTKVKFTSTTVPNNIDILMGKSATNAEYFAGNIDEVRIWHRALEQDEILKKSLMYIAGTEVDLSGYYRMNEGVGKNFFDLSRRGFTYNEKHGFISKATWSTVIPLTKQLAVKGLTDKNGNYIISGIPYSSDGSTYRIVPVYKVHSFDPTERLLFIGPGSNTFSDINFIDVSSFPVNGYVYYKNTKFPVEGVQIKIDGKPAVTSEGNLITTNSLGYFLVDVPIGRHNLQMAKSGHVFRNNGRFPLKSGVDFDFQSAYTVQQDFIDSTLIKVIGKVVGGPVQGEKTTGFGRTKNNIGNAEIILTTQKGYTLKDGTGDVISSWDNKYQQGAITKKTGVTNYTISNVAPKNISIKPDVITGEYFAYLLPERYAINSVKAGNYTFDASFNTVMDLESATLNKSYIDTVLVDSTLLANGTVHYNNRTDSVSYQLEKSFVLRVAPEISALAADGTPAFWDKKAKTPNGEIDIVNTATGEPLTQYPIFTQRGKYKLRINVFEKFINASNGNQEDKVPVKDGVVEIQNGLAINTVKESYEINDFGYVLYSFAGGLPNITTGGIGDYLKPMTIVALTGKDNAINTSWQYNGGPFYAYVLGGMPTGNNFVTTGPNEIEMILRDPYGSNSYAYLEKSSSYSKTTTREILNQEATSVGLDFMLGGVVKTFAGVGAGIITEVEIENSVSVGFDKSETWIDNNTTSSTTTSTKKWQTSNELDFVGANGDVFIGNSTNIVYGSTKFIQFVPKTNCTTCTDTEVGGFQIGLDEGVRISPEFGTAFMYTQYHIETSIIPNLKFLRNNYLKKKSNYKSVLSASDPNYGKLNSSGVGTRSDAGFSGGDSYNFTIPSSWPNGKEYIDTVEYYNQQVKNWENILLRNEREKLESTLKQNLSFDAGVKYESSVTYESSKSNESTFDFTISPSLSGSKGFALNKLGLKVSLKETYTHTETKTDGTQNTSTLTFGYVLEDSDVNDYYSIDVRQPSSETGPVFKVRGGQSSCPYVGAEYSKYYQKGTILSEATMKIEVPQIGSSNPIALNVPEDQKAIYTLLLSNASQTNSDVWYMLNVNTATNKDGARVSLDGADLGNGRLILVPAGTTLKKTLSIEKVKPDVFNYDDIQLVLHSVCEESLSDTVSLSARFQPVCTKVILSQPNDQWLINTSTIIQDGTLIKSIPLGLAISNYNLSHSGFEKILVQYKPSSSSQWISDMVYYVDQAQYNAASAPKAFIDSKANLQYTLETKSLQDRNYDIRVTTTCANGTVNNSTVVSGIKDIKRPRLFGTPQPADGILSPGEDVSIQFDEPIQAGLLISKNFQVKGVLNGAEIRHNSVIYFDGVYDNCSVIAGPDLKDKDFTIEFWTQRSNNTAGTIYSQGNLEIGFNASNKLYVKLGNQTLSTSQVFTSTLDWMHFAITYSNSDRKLNVFMNDKIPLENASVTGVFDPSGRIYIGRDLNGTSFYNGYIHEFRIWEKSRGFGTVYANMLISLSGSEVGLVGYWPMDDSRGNIAIDKARSHHAILNGSAWAVFPKGYAMNFNGTSGYFTIPTGTVVVTNEMDMTFEFWFKGPKKANQVLFSNGKGDQSDPTPPFNNIWVVGSDDLGKLYVSNNGTRLNVSKEVFDNEWHHLGVVVNRVANTSLYLDGNVETFQPSSNFGGLSGANLTLGARMFTSAGNITYDRYFEGKIDEVRIWKLARTRQLLNMDMNSKLKGDEKGLMAYYPFDKYDIDLILQPNNADNTSGSKIVPNVVTGTFGNLDIPNIKDARPVQNVAYDWVVNGDKIILNIKEPANLVEKTVLEFTVEDVEDKNENLLSSPITWTAFVKKNTVIWSTVGSSFEKRLYDPLSFTVEVMNIGGTEQNYDVTDLPSWLSVDISKGTLAPVSKKTLNFTVSPSVNLGNYEESIFLSSDFGFKEKFELKLKVFADKPNWVLDASKYQYNMSIIGSININGTVSTNPDDMIGAFVNDSLRGLANLKYVPEYDTYMFFMDVFSNKADGELVKFKVWNAAKGKIHVDVESDKAFIKDAVIGMPSKPQEFKVIENISSAYILEKGWNWISFNLNSKALKTSTLMFSELQSNEGDLVKGMNKFDQFGKGMGWLGEISKQGGFNLKDGYKMKVSAQDTFHLVGQSVLIDTVSIKLKTGWNWIGYPSQLNMAINDAMGNVNFDNGDFIKGQRSFAYYDKSLGWIGSLKFLNPQEGYMLQSKLPHNLTYPNPELLYSNKRVAQSRVDNTESIEPWSLKPSDYANTMSAMLGLNLCTGAIDTTNDYLGAFVGSECRGFVKPKYIAAYNAYVFFLTVYSNTPAEIITLKYFDGSLAKEFEMKQKVPFVNDMILGSVTSPVKTDLVITNACELLSVADEQYKDVSIGIYPNPFTNNLKIRLNNFDVNEVELSITDGYGHKVATPSVLGKGWEWNGLGETGNELSAGLYLLTVKHADKTTTFKLIKQ